MDIYINSKDGVTLHTEKKYCKENITVRPETANLNITPSSETQNFEGLYSNVNVDPITGEEITITPSTEEQVKEGVYTKVTVSGDSNLVAENIAKDVTIFGVTGTHEGGSSGGESSHNATYGYTGESTFTARKWLVEVGDLDLSEATSMASAFSGCGYITKVGNLKTPKVTSFSSAFPCPKMVELGEIDASSCTVWYSACDSATALTTFGGLLNIGKAYTQASNNYNNYQIRLHTCTNLTHDSLMNIINKLYDLNLTYDVANGGTLYSQQLVLGSTNLAKISSNELSIATSKGWSVS